MYGEKEINGMKIVSCQNGTGLTCTSGQSRLVLFASLFSYLLLFPAGYISLIFALGCVGNRQVQFFGIEQGPEITLYHVGRGLDPHVISDLGPAAGHAAVGEESARLICFQIQREGVRPSSSRA